MANKKFILILILIVGVLIIGSGVYIDRKSLNNKEDILMSIDEVPIFDMADSVKDEELKTDSADTQDNLFEESITIEYMHSSRFSKVFELGDEVSFKIKDYEYSGGEQSVVLHKEGADNIIRLSWIYSRNISEDSATVSIRLKESILYNNTEITPGIYDLYVESLDPNNNTYLRSNKLSIAILSSEISIGEVSIGIPDSEGITQVDVEISDQGLELQNLRIFLDKGVAVMTNGEGEHKREIDLLEVDVFQSQFKTFSEMSNFLKRHNDIVYSTFYTYEETKIDGFDVAIQMTDSGTWFDLVNYYIWLNDGVYIKVIGIPGTDIFSIKPY